ncbi:hypothetical protein ACQPXM_05715 [Kribbella sp. CA-253562]|uniref:hypothetical protein n=1 Tax=Kribbella sp. CA-253562 TaxID=3239942 RepID=UPI003D8DF763
MDAQQSSPLGSGVEGVTPAVVASQTGSLPDPEQPVSSPTANTSANRVLDTFIVTSILW